MEAVTGVGYGNLKFGLLEKDVVALLGDPNKKYEETYGNNRKSVYGYFSRRILLSFEEDYSSRLTGIEVRCKRCQILGRNVFEESRDTLLAFLCEQFWEKPAFEDYGAVESFTFDSSGIDLQFDLGLLYSIKIGVLFNEDDKPVWPSL